MAEGKCRLTGVTGRFVRAHIIPAALTRGPTGRPFAQSGGGKRPVRRWSSWYDQALVTEQGEAILAAYDHWGIRELRRNRLVWRSWGHDRELICEDHEKFNATHGVRSISADPTKMRLFFLSLLWRAAATNLHEFAEIQLEECELERLRQALVQGSPEAPEFFPVMLTQLSTRGPSHNMTAVAQVKRVPDLETGEIFDVPIFRFYFDGLVAHFHRPPLRDPDVARSPLSVGNGDRVVLSTIAYEASWQHENLETIRSESERIFPGAIDRTLGE